MTVIQRPNNITSTREGTLWTDANQRYLYRYGGNLIDPGSLLQNVTQYSIQSALVQFDTGATDIHSVEAWSVPLNATEPAVTRLAYGAGARSAVTGQGWYLGGFNDIVGIDHSSPAAEIMSMKNEMVIWDGGTGQGVSNSWVVQNVTAGAELPDVSYQAGADGVLIHLPIGNIGMLASIGGRPYEGLTAELSPMDNIRMYDIGNGTWYNQTATGDIPAPRNNFCGVMAPAQDNSSFNIYIAGGQTGGNTAVDDLYILTVPSFQWVKAYAGNNPPLWFHSCEVVRNQQMAIIGGFNATTLSAAQPCAPALGGDLKVFDMSNLSFGDYDSSKVFYSVPGAVLDIVGGNATGGATKNSPVAGWTDPLLEIAYTNSLKNEPVPSVRISPSASSTPTSTPSSAPHSSSLGSGATAGIAVGSLAAFFFLCALIFLILKRQHWSPQQSITLLLENGEKPLPAPPSAPKAATYSFQHKSGSGVTYDDARSSPSPGAESRRGASSPTHGSPTHGSPTTLPVYRSPTIPYSDRRPSKPHIATQHRNTRDADTSTPTLRPPVPAARSGPRQSPIRSLHELPAVNYDTEPEDRVAAPSEAYERSKSPPSRRTPDRSQSSIIPKI
ncbi:MAG: hypothetical protein M1827_004391 [Pycnora praestabilis]|nr:MAG: hypothetical protein M1827_004391 [Pycnora praestabilis]